MPNIYELPDEKTYKIMDITRLTLNIIIAAICTGINIKKIHELKKEGKSWGGEVFGASIEVFVLCIYIIQAYYVT